ncbi:replication-relaxation family protein [Streptomyces sclerotialus]|uniref:replication-relaxation family protein n=1 Tax=Streptomyces sclerotialus TaxID=1957 RepID=UPI0034A37E2A
MRAAGGGGWPQPRGPACVSTPSPWSAPALLPPGADGRPADWQVEVAHPTPAGPLIPDGAVLLSDGSHAFVEIDRTMSYARLLAKLERYDAYRGAPASG